MDKGAWRGFRAPFRLCWQMNAGTVEKLLHKIEDVKEALARRKDAVAKEAFEEVRKAEQMFLDALAEMGMRFEKGKIIGAGEEDDEVKKSKGIDKRGTVQYNKTHKSVYKQISKREYAVLSSEVTRKRAEYQSRGEAVPRYDCGYTDGYFYLYENLLDYHFGVVKQIVIKPETVDFIRKVERWVEQNARTDENARTVNRIIAGLRREKRHNSGRASDGEHGQSNYGADRVYGSEQASNGRRNNRGSGTDQRDGRVKKSRKTIDSNYIRAIERGDTNTVQKMVDEAARKAGYTIKAYHGTPVNGITVFDNKKIGSTTDEWSEPKSKDTKKKSIS